MPVSLPVPTKNPGDVLTSALWNGPLRDNLNKLLNTGHRTLTVAQFNSIVSPEGTKGTVAGDEVYLEVDAANGILWHLVYESTETTYKWRFLGGPPMVSSVVTAETTTSLTYAALTTAGPSIALPRAGDFDVSTGVQAFNTSVNDTAYMSYDIGGTGAVDADCILIGNPTTVQPVTASIWRSQRKTGLTAITLTAKYHSGGGGTVNFRNRYMTVTPTRLI